MSRKLRIFRHQHPLATNQTIFRIAAQLDAHEVKTIHKYEGQRDEILFVLNKRIREAWHPDVPVFLDQSVNRLTAAVLVTVSNRLIEDMKLGRVSREELATQVAKDATARFRRLFEVGHPEYR